MRVLCLHSAGAFGGAAKSLIELTQAMPAGTLDITVLCPRGTVEDSFRAAGFSVRSGLNLSQLDNTRYGHYRGMRWLVVLRELALVPVTIARLLRLHGRGFDLIYANEITLLGCGVLASRIFKAPLLVHVRSVQWTNVRSWRTGLVLKLLRRNVSEIVAIDETVRRSLPEDLGVNVVHNAFSFAVQEGVRRSEAPFRVAIVGILHASKGVYEFVEAARICRERGLAIEFLLVGENVRKLSGLSGWLFSRLGLARDVRADLDDMVRRYGLQETVRFIGFTLDVGSIYNAIDVLCFPSHLNAAGRPVFEAAFHEIPSIVAVCDPTPDTIVDGETGICIRDPDARLLAEAIEKLYRSPDLRRRMGLAARELANRYFRVEPNAEALLGIMRRAAWQDSAPSARTPDGRSA